MRSPSEYIIRSISIKADSDDYKIGDLIKRVLLIIITYAESRILWWVLLSQMLCMNFIGVSLDVAIVSMVNYSTSYDSTTSNATICGNTTSFLQIYDKSIVQRIPFFRIVQSVCFFDAIVTISIYSYYYYYIIVLRINWQ